MGVHLVMSSRKGYSLIEAKVVCTGKNGSIEAHCRKNAPAGVVCRKIWLPDQARNWSESCKLRFKRGKFALLLGGSG